jgi:KUP system potassium uptake protein
MQLGWFPGLRIRQTSDVEYGQIYVPTVNWVMMAFTVALTIGFGSSDRLAGAYGTAVSTTMLLTTILLGAAMRGRWGWSLPLTLSVCGFFLVVDLAFFAANLLKIAEGGWIPLVFGVVMFTIMTTWRKGVVAIRSRLSSGIAKPEMFLRKLDDGSITRSRHGRVLEPNPGAGSTAHGVACGSVRRFAEEPRELDRAVRGSAEGVALGACRGQQSGPRLLARDRPFRLH